MNQKEKATELIEKYGELTITEHDAKQCAIIAVDEIINALPMSAMKTYRAGTSQTIFENWVEVKTELEKM